MMTGRKQEVRKMTKAITIEERLRKKLKVLNVQLKNRTQEVVVTRNMLRRVERMNEEIKEGLL